MEAASDSRDIFDLLVAKGADIKAVRNGHEELVMFLVKNGTDVNAATKDGKTPLSVATGSGYTKIAEILKSNGAK